MNPAPRIRPILVEDDLDDIIVLVRRCDDQQREWAGEIPLPTREVVAFDWIQRAGRPGAVLLAAVDPAGALRGVCAYAQARTGDGVRVTHGVAHVSALFVDPDHWRQGIARALLAAAEEQMLNQSYRSAQLWTLEHSPAEQLYRALGWRLSGARDHYDPMDLPTVQYVKTLI